MITDLRYSLEILGGLNL